MYPEFQELYNDTQNYYTFRACIDSLIQCKDDNNMQLVYKMIWLIANLSMQLEITRRAYYLAVSGDYSALINMVVSINKTYEAELRNFGLINMEGEKQNAKPEGH